MNSNVEFRSVKIHNIEIQTSNIYEVSLYLLENEQLDYLGKGEFKNEDFKFDLD